MNVSIITVGGKHTPWEIIKDTVTIGKKELSQFFLQSQDPKVLQKIKLGEAFNSKEDNEFKELSPKKVVDESNTLDIVIQNFNLDFNKIYINTKNMNPYVVKEPKRKCDERLVILMLDNSYAYIRSTINSTIGEAICTFHTEKSIAVCIKVTESEFQKYLTGSEFVKLITFDVLNKGSFYNFSVNLHKEGVSVKKSKHRKKATCNHLSELNEQYKSKKVGRRFVRFSDKLITTAYISSIDFHDTTENLINKYPLSDVILEDSPIFLYDVNIDDKGFIIRDEIFENVIDDMKKKKIKSFTLSGCKLRKETFEDIKPLYIFSFQETEKLSEEEIEIQTLKCVKSN